MPSATLDFAYPWWLNYGHLAAFVVALALTLAVWALGWPRALMWVVGAVALWAALAALAVRSFNVNGVPALPTDQFLTSGVGRVLDIGAGTGRSSIMVLAARPQATLVALDSFGTSFEAHFGTGRRPQDRLLDNLRAAGVESRASIETGDMRRLPFEPSTFDAVVSAYAMDHVGRAGAVESLGEAYRVLKPRGDFLLILVANDWRAMLAFGPLLTHGGTLGAGWWSDRAREAGFEVREVGTQPLTLFLLLTRP